MTQKERERENLNLNPEFLCSATRVNLIVRALYFLTELLSFLRAQRVSEISLAWSRKTCGSVDYMFYLSAVRAT